MKIKIKELYKIKKIIYKCENNSVIEEMGYKPVDKFLIMCKVTLLDNQEKTEINFDNTVKGKITITCDRCLELFEYEICFNNVNKYDINEFKDEIDIDKEIRDNILLSFPMKFLCKDDCKGICQICGVNRNKEKCICKI